MRNLCRSTAIAIGLSCGFAFQGAVAGTITQLVVTPPTQDIWTTSVYSYAPGSSFPGGGAADQYLKVGGWGDLYYSLIEFDLNGLPKTASQVMLQLYDNVDPSSTTTPFDVYQITQYWNWQTQGTGTDRLRLWWADQPTVAASPSAVLPAATQGAYYYIDITNFYNAWQNGSMANYGIELRPLLNNDNYDIFASSRDTNPAHQPQLILTNPSGVSTVPEPPTWVIFGSALLATLLLQWRRRSVAAVRS